MATRRHTSGKRAAGRKRTAARRRTNAKRSSPPRGAREGALEARPEEAARHVEPQAERPAEVRTLHVAAVSEPSGKAAEPADRQTVAGEEPDARRRAEAEAELGRRREAADAASRWNGEGDLPGLSAIGVELALGAMRLARTVATAPLRMVLALLRSRD